MKLRFHCDVCDFAHPTADAAGKCERACVNVKATSSMHIRWDHWHSGKMKKIDDTTYMDIMRTKGTVEIAVNEIAVNEDWCTGRERELAEESIYRKLKKAVELACGTPVAP